VLFEDPLIPVEPVAEEDGVLLELVEDEFEEREDWEAEEPLVVPLVAPLIPVLPEP